MSVGAEHRLQLSLLIKIYHQRIEITITGYDNGFFIRVALKRGPQHHIGINIALDISLIVRDGRLQDDDKSGFLQAAVQTLIEGNKSNKEICGSDMILLL